MKGLIFLLILPFILSFLPIYIPQDRPGLLSGNPCLGDRIENRKFKCRNKTALIRYEYKQYRGCLNKYERNSCPRERYYLDGNECECKLLKGLPSIYSRLYNYTNIKECLQDKIRVGNIFNNFTNSSSPNIIPPYRHDHTLRIAKPVIYLYPKKTMDISVQLNIKNSEFTVIYPKFNEKNIWNVRAKPNGDILIKERKYPYLFWEADSYCEQETNEGFIVTDKNAEKFLEEKLEILGLNAKEKTDFIIFWLPILLKNKLSLCSFQSQKFYDNFELNVTPKPDSMIRIFLTIRKLNSIINVKEQKLVSNERKGFTVIEWGGSNI